MKTFGKWLLILSAWAVLLGRVFIPPRLSVPTLEGSFEAFAHLLDGFLILVPFYDSKQLLGPSLLYGFIGWIIAFWELGWYLYQSHHL